MINLPVVAFVIFFIVNINLWDDWSYFPSTVAPPSSPSQSYVKLMYSSLY